MEEYIDDNDTADTTSFYQNGKKYWESIDPTVDGMLGGLSHLSSVDVAESTRFLKQFLCSPAMSIGSSYALDCGAGIGRVTKKLLLPLFKNVDMVELNQHFLDKAPEYLGDDASKVGKFFCSGLQSFTPEVGKYNLIWCQWVLGHLTDEDLVDFFKRCRAGLTSNGLIVFKENISYDLEFDDKDSSYTRKRENFLEVVEKAGLQLIKEVKQKSFPSHLFEVRMFAVK